MFSIGLLCYLTLGTIPVFTVSGGGNQLSPENSLIWGPGLRADVVLPARYFYVQALDTEGQR